jgi:pSer/pThr/pTyr-binding forkhead associated (FHA) protein
VPEGLLTVLKFCFLALLYLFLFRVVRIVRLELKPAKVAVPAAAVGAEPAAAAPAGKVSKRESKKDKKSRGGAQLQLLDPPGRSGEVYPITEEVTVGRAPGCGVILDDDTFVSQVHARLFQRGRETYVEDLGSTNGTLVNGVRISEVTRLHRGDQVQFGSTLGEITR